MKNRFGEQRIIQSEDIIFKRSPGKYGDQRSIENFREYQLKMEEINWGTPDCLLPFWDAGIGKIEKVDGLWRHVVVFGEAEEIPEEGEWFKPSEMFNPKIQENYPRIVFTPRSRGHLIPLEIVKEINKNVGFLNSKGKILWKCEYE